MCWRSNLTNDNISSAYARSETCMDFRDPGLKTGVENNNYLVLNRVRIWRNWATHRPRIPRTHIPPAILCQKKKQQQQQHQQRQQHMKRSVSGAKHTLFDSEFSYMERERESPYNLRGNNKVVVP